MKRFRPLLGGLVLLAAATTASAQLTPEEVRQLQTRFQQAEEDNERLRARVQKLETAVAELRTQVGDVRNVAASAGKDGVTQEQLKKVVEQIREVDKHRQDDNDRIVQQLKRLADLPAVPAPAPEEGKSKAAKKVEIPAQTPTSTSTAAEPKGASAPADAKALLPADYEYYEHKVASGQTLGQIIAEYNKAYGLKVRLKHVQEANPKINPNKLIDGKKIRIPVVK
jgi:uncharacterized protein (UPF0335 family)